MNLMKKTIVLMVLAYALGVATSIGGFMFFPHPSGPPVPSVVADAIVPLREGAVTPINDSTTLYKNARFGFMLEYPQELMVREFDEAGGGMTVVFQKPGEQRGFQIFLMPYAESTITEERIRADIPSGSVVQPTEVVIGDGTRALHFSSTAPVIGESSEVWFIHAGFLYEVTTYAALDTWLAGILTTWKFY